MQQEPSYRQRKYFLCVSLGPIRARGCAQRKQIHGYWCDGECLEGRLSKCFIHLVFSDWAPLDCKCYSGTKLKIKHWFEDAATKDTSCVFSLSCLDLLLCQQLHHQHSATGTKVLFLANPHHGDGLCLLKPTFTLCSLGQLCKQRKGSVLGRGKSLAMLNQWCFIAFIKLMCCWLQRPSTILELWTKRFVGLLLLSRSQVHLKDTDIQSIPCLPKQNVLGWLSCSRWLLR